MISLESNSKDEFSILIASTKDLMVPVLLIRPVHKRQFHANVYRT